MTNNSMSIVHVKDRKELTLIPLSTVKVIDLRFSERCIAKVLWWKEELIESVVQILTWFFYVELRLRAATVPPGDGDPEFGCPSL